MQKTFPEWQVTLVWFIASIGATGAFWYFVAEKQKMAALLVAVATTALVVLAVLLSARNERLKQARLDRYGVVGLRQRLTSLALNVDSFVADRKARAREIAERGPRDQEMYRFELETERRFRQFWHEVVLLRDRVAGEFAIGDPRLSEYPKGTHDMSNVAQALNAVAAKLR